MSISRQSVRLHGETRRHDFEENVVLPACPAPSFAQALVRDLRVRWALEEADLPYRVTLVGDRETIPRSAYRAIQPFGQVPAIEDGDLTLFESGAIVLHVAE